MSIYEIAKKNDANAMKAYIASGGNVNAKNNEDNDLALGVTALIVAALNNRYDVAKLLVDAGADVNLQSNDGLTALLAASAEGYLDIMTLLIEANADINAKERVNLWTPLISASGENQLAAVELLIEAGADVNSTDKWGRTALIVAAERGFSTIAKALIDANADVNVVILPPGISALERAKAKGHSDIAGMLEAAGAKR
jgi:uncharacterized protein